MSKQIFKCRTTYNPLEFISKRSFYRNYDAVNHFIRYLRKRQVVVGTRPEKKKLERAPKAMIFKFDARNTYDLAALNLGEWWTHKKDRIWKLIESYQYKQYLVLGPDLAAAKFVIEFGGKVKFKNHSEWIDKTKKDEVAKLPKEYDIDYILEGIDLNGYPLRYEHLDFIFNLYYLKELCLKGCKTIDDWSLDKMSVEYPMLERLDVSECDNLTERGLECLYRMPSLTTLTVTNHYGSAAFDLTCFLLEDVNPNLTCVVQQAKLKRLPAY